MYFAIHSQRNWEKHLYFVIKINFKSNWSNSGLQHSQQLRDSMGRLCDTKSQKFS